MAVDRQRALDEGAGGGVVVGQKDACHRAPLRVQSVVTAVRRARSAGFATCSVPAYHGSEPMRCLFGQLPGWPDRLPLPWTRPISPPQS